MICIIILISAPLGLAVGSFLNAVIYRLHHHKSIVRGHSQCPRCRHRLGPADLIPLVSYLILRGKCRYCGRKISSLYPIVEAAAAIGFVAVALQLVFQYQAQLNFSCFLTTPDLINWLIIVKMTVFWWAFLALMILIFVYDLRWQLIPNKFVFPAIVIALVFKLILLLMTKFYPWIGYTYPDFLYGLILGAALCLLFYGFHFCSKGKWMGQGDAKLVLAISLWLGWPDGGVAVFLAFILGAAFSIILLLLGKKKLQDKIAFGTFLTSAALFAFFVSRPIINWYLNLIGF